MTAPRLTWSQAYEGGRILAKLGEIEVGAVFPNSNGSAAWRFWLRFPGITHGNAKSVQAAQNRVSDAAADWLREAGLRQT